jgi:hypothetical protein
VANWRCIFRPVCWLAGHRAVFWRRRFVATPGRACGWYCTLCDQYRFRDKMTGPRLPRAVRAFAERVGLTVHHLEAARWN